MLNDSATELAELELIMDEGAADWGAADEGARRRRGRRRGCVAQFGDVKTNGGLKRRRRVKEREERRVLALDTTYTSTTRARQQPTQTQWITMR